MADKETNQEKRRITTFLDPKLLQIFIPLLLAAGSGFLMHDRAISVLESQSVENIEHINELYDESKRVDLLLGDVLLLKERVERLQKSHDGAEELLDDLTTLVTQIDQRLVYDEEQVREFRTRIRDLERRVDKLTD